MGPSFGIDGIESVKVIILPFNSYIIRTQNLPLGNNNERTTKL
jgi:hypothetical protein